MDKSHKTDELLASQLVLNIVQLQLICGFFVLFYIVIFSATFY